MTLCLCIGVTQRPRRTSARRKEVPRDFLKGKIEKFTMKLERAKSAGNEDDITKYTAKVSCCKRLRARNRDCVSTQC